MSYLIASMQPEDWPQVCAIYSEGIATGHATFETNAPDWEHWDAGHLPNCRLAARNEQTILDVASQFGAHYLVLETSAVLKPMKNLFENPDENPNFIYLGELDDAKLYRIEFK